MVLLDYIGNRGLQLPREGTSDAALWARLRAAAGRVGTPAAFPPGSGVGDLRRPHAVPATPGSRRST